LLASWLVFAVTSSASAEPNVANDSCLSGALTAAGDLFSTVKDNRVYSMSPIFIQQVHHFDTLSLIVLLVTA
jgi:hypothetical protein